MSTELSPLFIEQQLSQVAVVPRPSEAAGWRTKIARIATAGLLVAGSTFAAFSAEETIVPIAAHADTLGYPWSDATYVDANYDWGYSSCPDSDTGCMNPFSGYLKGVKYGESDPWAYYLRNCTSYVAWKESTLGVTVGSLGNGGDWYNNASQSEKSSTPAAWDAAVEPGTAVNPYGHVAFVESVNSDGTITVSEYNHDAHGNGDTRTGTAASMGFTEFVDFGVHPSSDNAAPGGDLHGFIQVDAAINAKANRGFGGWTQEVTPGNASQFAIGGTYQMFLRGDGAAFAKNTLGAGGWTQETNPGGASAIAVSSTGLLVIIGTDNAVYSQRGISPPNWLQEIGPGNAAKIAVGGDNMMFLRGDGAEFAKTGQGGPWTQETNPGGASAVAVSSTGIHLIIGTDNAVYSKPGNGFGGWTQEVGPGNAGAISLAADNMMFLRGDRAVFGKVGRGGPWIQETDPNAASAIAVGANGLNEMLVINGEIDTRPGFGFGGWTAETSPSSATAIAASQ